MPNQVFPHALATGSMELEWTGNIGEAPNSFVLRGKVRQENGQALPQGFSIRLRSLTADVAEEVFLQPDGSFQLQWGLPEQKTTLELTVCDDFGREVARVFLSGSEGADLAAAVDGLEGDPVWPVFQRLARRCLDLSVEVARKTGRERDDLFAHVHAQEKYAERACASRDQASFLECRENLERYEGYLQQLLADSDQRAPLGPRKPPRFGPEREANGSRPREKEDSARQRLDDFRGALAEIWKRARESRRADLEHRLKELAGQAAGLSQRVKVDPVGAEEELDRLKRLLSEIAGELGR